MTAIDERLVDQLREMARRGQSVAEMYDELHCDGSDPHIVDVLAYFRSAFGLSLGEAKPICALTRSEGRQVSDAPLLEALVRPAIDARRSDWDR